MVDSGADTLHIDVMDGHFVPNMSFGIPAVKGVRKHTNAFMDCHLMVCNPRQWLPVFHQIGVQGFTFHVEATKDAADTIALIKEIKACGIRAGVALKPQTPASAVLDTGIAEEADMILVMTVEPGFGGQSFMQDMMPKVTQIRQAFPQKDIQVDGGIALDTIQIVADAGANVVVSGSGVFGAQEGPEFAITNMRNVINASIEKRASDKM